MSAYKQSTPEMRRRGRPRKTQAPRIIPHAIMRSTNPDAPQEIVPGDNVRKFASALRNNSGPAIKLLGSLLNPEPPYKFERIESVTEIANKDNSIVFLEIRIVRQASPNSLPTPSVINFPENPTKLNKEYKHIYLGDKIWPLDDQGQERTERSAWCSTSSALMQVGLFLPTNGPAALEHLQRHRRELDEYNRRLSAFKAAQEPSYQPQDIPPTFPETQPPTPVFIWTEGEKARRGVESYLNEDDPQILSLLEEYNVEITTLGVLAGEPGARGTNYTLRPYSNDFIIKGVNDDYLELPLALHIYARDNDDEGRTEANITAQSLIKLGVPADQVRIASPPVNALPKWDDGDILPPGMTAVDRLKQILDAPSTIGQYVFRSKGKGEEIDPTNHDNKQLAVQRISTAIFDETSTGERHFVITGETLSHKDCMYMAKLCLREMGHQPTDNLLRESDWRPVFTGRFNVPIESRNFIYEEIMRAVEEGQSQLSSTPNKEVYNPETYLLDAFNLPDTPRNRLISKIMIRDYVAITLRPHLDKNPVILQSLYVLPGEEGIGKSEFCKVLAGGEPGPESFHHRYSNSVDINDLKTIGDRSMASFANKSKGRTVLEFSDKALGDAVSVAQNGLLNDLANISRIEFREPYKTHTSFPRQFLIIFTTNRGDLIGHNMGRRRWIIADTNQSMKGFSKLSYSLRQRQKDPKASPLIMEEELIAQGHNPGILKNYHKRSATLAYMYNSNEWKGSLIVPPELTQDMEEERRKFSSVTSWELILEEMLTMTPYGPEEGSLATESRMIVSSSAIRAIKDTLGPGSVVALNNFGNAMARLGYFENTKKNKRGWSKSEQPAPLVKEYAVFTDPPYTGMKGKWVFRTDPDDPSTERMVKQVDPETFT